jgi:hypothetical protein
LDQHLLVEVQKFLGRAIRAFSMEVQILAVPMEGIHDLILFLC